MDQEKSQVNCDLDLEAAIRIAKIISTAPAERMPMITDLFRQAGLTLSGLEELIEGYGARNQGNLIDTSEFLHELVAGIKPDERGYIVDPEKFNLFCIGKNIQPRLVKKHLYSRGLIEASTEKDGKLTYTVMVRIDGISTRRIIIKKEAAAWQGES